MNEPVTLGPWFAVHGLDTLDKITDELDQAWEQRNKQANKIRRLEAIIAKLQTTADGVPVVEGDTVFSIEADGSIYEGKLRWWGTRGPAKLGMDGGYRNELRIWMTSYHEPKDCYSTHEAAESTQSLARGVT